MGSKNIIFKTKGGETIPETSDSALSCVKVYQTFCDKTLIEILLKEAVLQTLCSSAEGCFTAWPCRCRSQTRCHSACWLLWHPRVGGVKAEQHESFRRSSLNHTLHYLLICAAQCPQKDGDEGTLRMNVIWIWILYFLQGRDTPSLSQRTNSD